MYYSEYIQVYSPKDSANSSKYGEDINLHHLIKIIKQIFKFIFMCLMSELNISFLFLFNHINSMFSSN